MNVTLSVHEARLLLEEQTKIREKISNLTACGPICSIDLFFELLTQLKLCQTLIAKMWISRGNGRYFCDEFNSFHKLCWGRVYNDFLQEALNKYYDNNQFIKNINWKFDVTDSRKIHDINITLKIEFSNSDSLSWDISDDVNDLEEGKLYYNKVLGILVENETDESRKMLLKAACASLTVSGYLDAVKNQIKRMLENCRGDTPFQLGYFNSTTSSITYQNKKYYVPNCIKDICVELANKNKEPYDKLNAILLVLKNKHEQSNAGKRAARFFGRGRSRDTENALDQIAEILSHISKSDLATLEAANMERRVVRYNH